MKKKEEEESPEIIHVLCGIYSHNDAKEQATLSSWT